MIEAKIRVDLQQLPTKDKIEALRNMAVTSFDRVSSKQYPNGLIPASLGTFENDEYRDMVWVKDHWRAIHFALDPYFQATFPNLASAARQFFLKATDGMLRVQAQPEVMRRFQTRPGGIPDEQGYLTINDAEAAPMKFDKDGQVVIWTNNQPDNWGTQSQTLAKAIAAGWPVLEKGQDGFMPGTVINASTAYLVGAKTERLICRSIWEHRPARSSYSTRRTVLAGLEETVPIWPKVEEAGDTQGYKLSVTNEEIQEAADRLREKTREHAGDYTDVENHYSAGDLASLVVLNEVDNLSEEEQEEIRQRLAKADLENRIGFHRYIGDHYEKEVTETEWTLGKPALARYYFRKAIELAREHPTASQRALHHGIDRIQDILDIQLRYGRVPELFKHIRRRNGTRFQPNKNILAWTESYIIEAVSAGVVALEMVA